MATELWSRSAAGFRHHPLIFSLAANSSARTSARKPQLRSRAKRDSPFSSDEEEEEHYDEDAQYSASGLLINADHNHNPQAVAAVAAAAAAIVAATGGDEGEQLDVSGSGRKRKYSEIEPSVDVNPRGRVSTFSGSAAFPRGALLPSMPVVAMPDSASPMVVQPAMRYQGKKSAAAAAAAAAANSTDLLLRQTLSAKSESDQKSNMVQSGSLLTRWPGNRANPAPAPLFANNPALMQGVQNPFPAAAAAAAAAAASSISTAPGSPGSSASNPGPIFNGSPSLSASTPLLNFTSPLALPLHAKRE